MLRAQKAFVSSIVRGFDSRIQNKQIALDLREFLDFRRMPLANSEASNALLMTHGDDAVERVVRSHFPGLDAEIVKDELLAAKFFVRETQARYLQQSDPDDATKGTILLQTGRGSIFEALFSRSDVCSKPIPSLLIIADYMMSFMWQSCCGERAGSHINRTKTRERTLLGDQTFDSLMFNTSTCRICTRWNSTRSTPGGPRAVTRWAPSMAVVTAGSRRPGSCAATSQQHRRRSSSRPAIEVH